MSKLVFVTGAGRGIGRTIALKLAEDGFTVAGCARSQKELDETRKLSGNKVRVSTVDVRDVDALQKWFFEESKSADVTPWGLVTAAGVYGPIGPFVENSWEAWRESVEINLFGTLLAVKIFAKSLIEKNRPGRIVLLSGGGATKPIPNFSSYCVNKSGVVRFGETLAYELKPHGITVNSIAPGLVNTKLTDEVLAAGPDKAGREMYETAIKQKEGEAGVGPEKAAQLASYLMGEQPNPVTGRLISAIWDPWDQLHQWNEKLIKSDVYTLRRITPRTVTYKVDAFGPPGYLFDFPQIRS